MRELQLPQGGELWQGLRRKRRNALAAQVVAGEHELLEAGEAAEGGGEVPRDLGPLQTATAEVEVLQPRELRQRRGGERLQALLLELVEGYDELLEACQLSDSRSKGFDAGWFKIALRKDELLQILHLRKSMLSKGLCTVFSEFVVSEVQSFQINKPPQVRCDHLHGRRANAAVGQVEIPQLDELREAIGSENFHKISTKVVSLEVQCLHLGKVLEAGDCLGQETRSQARTLQIKRLELLRLGRPLLLAEGQRPHKLARGLALPEVQGLEVRQLRRAGRERLNSWPCQVAPPHIKDLQLHKVHDCLCAEHHGPFSTEMIPLVAKHIEALDVLEGRGQLLRSCSVQRTV
mmetsp:Transcript_41339/g.119657  ORF Transcript_41339/g.119657 Transcript_41339/m.119657 type:complete len:348 (-) Transcript_41339:401-1444(-)